MGIFSFLFGCSTKEHSKEHINYQKSWHYVYDTKTNEVFYKYSLGGALLPRYEKLYTTNPKNILVLDQNYATDGQLVFYKYDVIENANPKGFVINPNFPDFFSKDTISKHHFYKDELLNLDFSSARIHSINYVSDKEKVLYSERIVNSSFNTEVPVQDVLSFESVDKKSKNGFALGKDKFWFYLNQILVPIPPQNTQIIQLGSTSIFFNDNTLHYIVPPNEIRDKNLMYLRNEFPNLKFTYDGIIGKTKYDTYNHFKISGFKNLSQIDDSFWFKDDNGLYHIPYYSEINVKKISNKQYQSYECKSEFPNYLRTESNLFACYFEKLSKFSNTAKIVDGKFVIDRNAVFCEGVKIDNADASTFVKIDNFLLDKDFIYSSLKHNYRKRIPHWAYEELKNRNISLVDSLFDISMKYAHTIHKNYWNGFLVNMHVPTKSNTDKKLYIEFKNIERKTLKLEAPLEKKLLLIPLEKKRQGFNLISEYNYDALVKLNPTTPYNFNNIENDEIIKFTADLPGYMTDNTNEEVMYFITLSSTSPPEEDNYDQLYIESSEVK